MGVGGIIGAGIFIVTGVASAASGPALMISFIVAAIACTFTALCYAEFASMIPIAGSVYTYTYITMGEIWAWIMGWIMILQYLIASAAVAIGWSSYVVAFLTSLGIALPAVISGPLGIPGIFNQHTRRNNNYNPNRCIDKGCAGKRPCKCSNSFY